MNYKDAKEEIKNRISIVDVIKEYVDLKRSGSSYFGICPFHVDKNPSMSVSESLKIFKCFACNEGGDVFHFLELYLKISYFDAVKLLANRLNIEIDNDFTSNENYKKVETKKKKLYALHKDIANIYYKYLHSEIGKSAYNYLRNERKLTDQTILKFGIGYAPKDCMPIYNTLKDKGYDDELLIESTLFRLDDENRIVPFFFDRIIFPVVDINNNIIGFQSRTLNKDQKAFKYLNSKSTIVFQKDSVFYAYNFAFRSEFDYYIICEGNMDVITLNQSGYDNAIAAQGTAFNDNLIFLLKRKPKKIYLCQDMDDAGIKSKNNAAEVLRKHGFETYMIDLSPSKDVDEFINDKRYGVTELKKRFDNPIPSILYFISSAKRNLDLNNPYDYEKFLNEIVKKLASIENAVVRESYIKQAAIREGIDTIKLLELVNSFLKGNRVSADVVDSKSANEQHAPNGESDHDKSVYKYESELVMLSFLHDSMRKSIINAVKIDELNTEICRLLYQKYIDGCKIDDLTEYIEGLDEKLGKEARKVIYSNSEYSDQDKESIVKSLNYIIRHIKIYNAKKQADKSLDGIYKTNMMINDINKTDYIK